MAVNEVHVTWNCFYDHRAQSVGEKIDKLAGYLSPTKLNTHKNFNKKICSLIFLLCIIIAFASQTHPVFVLVPGAAQTPSHYAYLLHLLHSKGYPTLATASPSTLYGSEPVSAEDDAEFIRKRMLLPVLDLEKHDVILIMHSYSGIPGSASARGLGKAERTAQGKTTSVQGQIFISSVIAKGGDGRDIVATFGGQLPPHIRVDVGDHCSINILYICLGRAS